MKFNFDMLNEVGGQFLIDNGFEILIYPIVEYEGNKMYKSTLVNQLKWNLFLFKDNLHMWGNQCISIIQMIIW
jgi:hypothetical protein